MNASPLNLSFTEGARAEFHGEKNRRMLVNDGQVEHAGICEAFFCLMECRKTPTCVAFNLRSIEQCMCEILTSESQVDQKIEDSDWSYYHY